MTARLAISRIASDLKWMIVVSILLSLILYLPGQTRELYRITYAAFTWTSWSRMFVPVLLISAVLWWGTNQVATESIKRIVDPSSASATEESPTSLSSAARPAPALGASIAPAPKSTGASTTAPPAVGSVMQNTFVNGQRPSQARFAARLAPAIIAALPLIACAVGQFYSVPSGFSKVDAALNVVGSTWRDNDIDLTKTVGHGLQLGSAALGTVAVIFAAASWAISGRVQHWSEATNGKFCGHWQHLVLSTIVTAILLAAYVLIPLALPRAIGTFAVVSTFAICLTLFSAYFSLLTIRYKLPIIPLIVSTAYLFSYCDLNDNHRIRLLRTRSENDVSHSAAVPLASDEFLKWLTCRPDLRRYTETQHKYPVYVVSAQGGGIYAAYQAAIFLARLQDVCPAFRDHLFAISSVSGGSFGAATFVAALDASTRGSLRPCPASGSHDVAASTSPCPDITRFLVPDKPLPLNLEHQGALERKVSDALSADFLSPLVAATLFPDFAQRFLFFPVPSFDRARALEYTFEAATADIDQGRSFTESYLSQWSPAGSTPAILMNATDSGSGRRVLIAPFRLQNDRSNSGVLASTIPFSQYSVDIRLSTAIGISARFAWITPAATVSFGSANKTRLVDGGYVDNSGVETALDLYHTISEDVRLSTTSLIQDDARHNPSTAYPAFRINLIVLSGGDFPTRNSFAFGETLEPIRAFLSARVSRAYVAINRARTELPPIPIATRDVQTAPHQTKKVEETADRVMKATVDKHFYALPLGWALSGKTRDIIAKQSGRYWDCAPNLQFQQLPNRGSTADCVQLQVYHELSQSIDTAGNVAALDNYGRALFGNGSEQIKPRLNHETLIGCYCRKLSNQMTLLQTENLRALLDLWDQHTEWSNDVSLAYILGTVAHESGNFSFRTENLSYTPAALLKQYPRIFPTINDAIPYVNNPEALANKIYGEIRDFGNIEPGDGWRYRGRGMVMLTGRYNYGKYGNLAGVNNLVDEPDLIEVPDVDAHIVMAYFFPNEKISRLQQYLTEQPPDWVALRRMVIGGVAGLEDVKRKTEIFLGCVREAKGLRQSSPSNFKRVMAFFHLSS